MSELSDKAKACIAMAQEFQIGEDKAFLAGDRQLEGYCRMQVQAQVRLLAETLDCTEGYATELILTTQL